MVSGPAKKSPMPERARAGYKKKFTERKRRFNEKAKTSFKRKVRKVVDRNIETKLSPHKIEGSISGAIDITHSCPTLTPSQVVAARRVLYLAGSRD
jgi:hypothetical protein